MWQSIVSIDSKYTQETQLLQERFESFEQLYFAKNTTPSRVFYSIAGREEDFTIASSKILSIIADIVVVNMKFHYFVDLIGGHNITDGLASVVSALVGYEQVNEYDYVIQALDQLYEYSIDGFIKFRLQNVVDEWAEVGEMLTSMVLTDPSEKELFGVAIYLMNGKKKGDRIFIADSEEQILTTVNTKKVLKVRGLFENKNQNILQTLINFNPADIVVDSKKVDKGLIECLKNVFPLKIL